MKIGFLAMSGIRACDQELLKLGLTLPGFVERSRKVASLPSRETKSSVCYLVCHWRFFRTSP